MLAAPRVLALLTSAAGAVVPSSAAAEYLEVSHRRVQPRGERRVAVSPAGTVFQVANKRGILTAHAADTLAPVAGWRAPSIGVQQSTGFGLLKNPLAVSTGGRVAAADFRTSSIRIFSRSGKRDVTIRPESDGLSGADVDLAYDGTTLYLYKGTGAIARYGTRGRLMKPVMRPRALAGLTIAHMDARGGVVWLLTTADSGGRRKVVRVTRAGAVRVYTLADGPKQYVTDLDIGSDGRPRLLTHVRVTGAPSEERLTILDPTSGQESDAGLLTPAQPRPAPDDFLDLDCHDQPVTASIDGLSVYRAPGVAACGGAR